MSTGSNFCLGGLLEFFLHKNKSFLIIYIVAAPVLTLYLNTPFQKRTVCSDWSAEPKSIVIGLLLRACEKCDAPSHKTGTVYRHCKLF